MSLLMLGALHLVVCAVHAAPSVVGDSQVIDIEGVNPKIEKGGSGAFDKVAALSNKDSDKPIFISADTLELAADKKQFTYKGNVTVAQGDTTLSAETVTGKYGENSKIKEVVCEKNVTITKGEGMRATSDKAVYIVDSGVIELTKSPEVVHSGNALSADRITIFIDEDRSEADGNVRVRVVGDGLEDDLSLKKLGGGL